MEAVQKSISELKTREIEIYSADQIDLELKRNTNNHQRWIQVEFSNFLVQQYIEFKIDVIFRQNKIR